MNRITKEIARMRTQIADRIAAGLTTKEKVAKTHKDLDMDVEELAKFQTLKSLAVEYKILTLDEGQTLYALLGETPSVFNAQPIEVKVTLTSTFKELLNWHIKCHSKACK